MQKPCDLRDNLTWTCKWFTKCDEVRKIWSTSLGIYVNDEVPDKSEYEIPLLYDELFISGVFMGINESQNTCYLTVFDHGLSGDDNNKLIILGSLFMEKYYTVYDMSPLD